MPSVLASAAVGLRVAEALECESDTTNAKDCESANCNATGHPAHQPGAGKDQSVTDVAPK
ncbi:hypothetical protein ABH941_000854 [Streptacidiphilus sp. EB103A]